MRAFFILCFSILSVSMITPKNALAHCEVPCGIYDDSVRIKLIYEHISTIEKAMNQINALEKKGGNYNQSIRWVMNKEKHAEKIQEIVSQYFLHQRIKLTNRADAHAYSHYVQKLELLHKLAVYAMKTKQTTDLKYVQNLRSTLAAFEKAYFSHSH